MSALCGWEVGPRRHVSVCGLCCVPFMLAYISHFFSMLGWISTETWPVWKYLYYQFIELFSGNIKLGKEQG